MTLPGHRSRPRLGTGCGTTRLPQLYAGNAGGRSGVDYRSNGPRGCRGEMAEVVKGAYPDPTQFDTGGTHYIQTAIFITRAGTWWTFGLLKI